MDIRYLDPLSRAWERMRTILFTPFDLSKWLALGFTAFLAHLLDSHGGGNYGDHKDVNVDELFDFPARALEWMLEHPVWMFMIAAGLVVLIVVLVVFTWLSSRGIFMFLDNVVHNRSRIQKPWNDFSHLGDSLFVWRLAFGVVSIGVVGFLIFSFFSTVRVIVKEGLSSHWDSIAGMVLLSVAVVLVIIFISRMLTDFIAPIMYQYNLPVNDAWEKFLPLFLRHTWEFILYGVFTIVLWIMVAILIALGGIFTCCCGFVLLIIPYIGSVLMLPVSVTFRAFSLEFLGQFGEDYKIFPTAADTPPMPGSADLPPTA